MRALGFTLGAATLLSAWLFSWPASLGTAALLGLSSGLIIAGPIRPRRSPAQPFSPASNDENPTTAERVATYTGYKPDGLSQAGEATPPTLRLASSFTEPGSSTAALASRLGARSTAANRPSDCGCSEAS